jgi:crotonobetainyl-CoA:carnitine CoA-transferase CaiB-like acyl-CoA transferase
MKEIFKGMQVLELASVLAGPGTGLFFGELGARVQKIENKTTGGDVTRKWKLQSEAKDAPFSAYYASVNHGKEICLLDLNLPEDREKVYLQIASADVVITNFREKEAKKLGMRYVDFQIYNMEIIHGNITAYGEHDERPGFDLLLQAETGFMSMNGSPESGPLKMPVAMIDLLASHQLKEGLLVAMLQKMKTGQGAYVSVSLYETALASLVNQASNYLNSSYVPGTSGSLHPNIAPYGEILHTRDGSKIVLAIGTDKQFIALCQLLDLGGLASEPPFATNADRVKHRVSLNELLNESSRRLDVSFILERASILQVPLGKIHSLDVVFSAAAAQDMIRTEIRDGMLLKSVSSVAFAIRNSSKREQDKFI